MAENLEHFHVPQQNRKTRLGTTQQQQEFSFVNPSSFPFSSCLQTSQQQGSFMPLSIQLGSRRHNNHNNNNNGVSVVGDFLKPNNGGSGIVSSVPFGPFTGYASILKSSRFLNPTQQVLDDVCGTVNCEVLDFSVDCLSGNEVMRANVGFSDRLEQQWKNSKLVLMLDEVYRRYKLYCQQMQSVVESFATVAGLGNAAPYLCYAIKIVSRHFSCLKNALLDQLHFTGKLSDSDTEKIPRFLTADEQGSSQSQNPALNFSFLHHPALRSHRGLPDPAVAVLKSWLFEHFLHPYPTDSEKQILAQQTGLSRTQVSNWFINARVRLWKPMVEEVYKLASQKAQEPTLAVDHNPMTPSNFSVEKSAWTSNQQRVQNVQTKRSRNEPADVYLQREELRNANFDSLTGHFQTGIGGSNGVSLALGLHLNHGIDLSRPLPVGIAQHVSPETINMIGSASTANFQAQNHHFGKK